MGEATGTIKLTSMVVQCRTYKGVELYLHSPIRLRDKLFSVKNRDKFAFIERNAQQLRHYNEMPSSSGSTTWNDQMISELCCGKKCGRGGDRI
jgi:hypothetical protein